jgi:hypothetical protein
VARAGDRDDDPGRVPAKVARVRARLGLAVTRGLLLDLLATGDRDGVDEAMQMFIAWYEGSATRT